MKDPEIRKSVAAPAHDKKTDSQQARPLPAEAGHGRVQNDLQRLAADRLRHFATLR
jgi:hypothetical protein